MQLTEIISEAYALFAPYTIGKTLSVCKACCITDAEEAELVSTPLRQVSRTLLQNAYYESARNYSERELWEMKHFLPRVLELVSGFEFPCHSLEITFTRLDLNQPDKWPAAERQLLRNFATTYVANCLARYPLPEGVALTEILIMFGIAHFELPGLLAQWSGASSDASLLHFKEFMLHDASYSKTGAFTLTNPFTTTEVSAAFAAWLRDEQVKQAFLTRIESRLLNPQGLSEADTSELSWAYDILPTL